MHAGHDFLDGWRCVCVTFKYLFGVWCWDGWDGGYVLVGLLGLGLRLQCERVLCHVDMGVKRQYLVSVEMDV